MLTLNQRSQNDVRVTLISRCRRCQPIFNQISTSKRRRMPTGYFLDSTTILNQTLEFNNFEMHFRVVVKDVRLKFSL